PRKQSSKEQREESKGRQRKAAVYRRVLVCLSTSTSTRSRRLYRSCRLFPLVPRSPIRHRPLHLMSLDPLYCLALLLLIITILLETLGRQMLIRGLIAVRRRIALFAHRLPVGLLLMEETA
ncbi:hypothetical protein FB639_004130, partial [Coemansia asiatica]